MAKVKSTPVFQGLTLKQLTLLEEKIDTEIALFQIIINKFKEKYGNLEEFEHTLETCQIPEHPQWEESIEFRNATEELQNLKTLRSILTWTHNCLQ